MSRFKASKYKNAAAKKPGTQDCINNLRVGDVDSYSNHIKANCTFLAFNSEGGQGGNLVLIPYNSKDTVNVTLSAHNELVTDFDFSPFDDFLLATSSRDCSVKIWRIADDGAEGSTWNPLTHLTNQHTVEAVLYNPAAENILATASNNEVKVWDISTGQEKYSLSDHTDVVQSFTWKGDGSLIATACKDKKIRVFDPRSSSKIQESQGFDGGKTMKVLWAGDTDHVFVSGCDKARSQQIGLWDSRSLERSLKKLSFGVSTITPMVFFDADTNMTFVASKGETSIHYVEMKDTQPYLTQVSTYRMEEQIKGVALIPKLGVDVMKCEIVRLLVLGKSSITPIGYHVPRKSYNSFHADLFPDTFSDEPSMTSDEWLQGNNTPRQKTSLDPSLRKVKEKKIPPKPVANIATKPESHSKTESAPSLSEPRVESSDPKVEDTARSSSLSDVNQSRRTSKRLTNQYHSKYRHLVGAPLQKNQYIENIRNLNTSTFNESDGFQVNSKRCAFPLEGAGGKVAVWELAKIGRLPESSLPALENKSSVMDFAMNPFDDRSIAVACENSSVKLWKVPEDGLTEIIDEPIAVLKGHRDRVSIVRYHPTANNILTSASYDMTVNIWDVNAEKAMLSLVGHLEPLYSFAWNKIGNLLATFSRDHNFRLFDARASTSSIAFGQGPAGGRGGRVAWVGPHAEWVLLSGFDRAKSRQISLYDSRDLMKELTRVTLGISTSTLVPHFDEDTNVCILSGKADTSIYSYEIIAEPPHLFQLSDIKLPDAHQAVAFCRKTTCDVKQVEFLKAFRLMKTCIEPFVFSVPRVQKEYFQDDIFCDTRVTWEPSLSSDDWLKGENKEQRKISLKPPDMKLLSKAPKVEIVKKYESKVELDEYKTDEQKKEELLKAMDGKLANYGDTPLPQDLSEGVDESEWDDY